MSTWWLISDEDVDGIRAGLMADTHEATDGNCEDWPIGSGCAGCQGDEARRQALHTLDSGLHVTDAIPGDFEDGA